MRASSILRTWFGYLALLSMGMLLAGCEGDDKLSRSECAVTPLADGGVTVDCPGAERVSIGLDGDCQGVAGFQILGLDGIGGEAVADEPNEFVVLTDSTRPVELSFAGLGSFSVVDAEALKVSAVFPNEGTQAFSVIATNGCSVEVWPVQLNVVGCFERDCSGVCLPESYFESHYGDQICDARFDCVELNRDGGDCSCEDRGLDTDCWGQCIDVAALGAVGDGTCDLPFACELYSFDGGDCMEGGRLYEVGEFVIEVAVGPDGHEGIRVWHVTEPDRVIWSVPSLSGFLLGAPAELLVEETRGSFKMIEAIGPRCSSTGLELVMADGDKARFHVPMEGMIDECTRGATLEFDEPTPGHLRFSVSSIGDVFEFIELTYASESDEHFFGFGEQFSNLDHAGQVVPVLSQEQGVGRGRPGITELINTLSDGSAGSAYTTYCSMPHYISSENRSVMLENTEYSVFDLSEPEEVKIRLFGTDMTGRIFYGNSYYDLIERLTDFTGRMPGLPEWFHKGAVIGMQGGLSRVYEVWDSLAALETPMSSFWLQDWVGKRTTSIGSQLWWNWELDRASYPANAWAMMVEEMNAAGIRPLGYINPFLVDAADKGDATRNLFGEAAALGYAVKNEAGEAYEVEVTDFPTFLVDFTNPEARAWLKDVIREQMLGIGLRGWMADFSEGLPFDAVLHSGVSAKSYHNQYMVDWVKLNREVIEEEGLMGEVVFFNRAGYTGSQGYSTAFWAGDQAVTWDGYDGFQSSLKALMGGGFSGISINHSDIGGYTSISVAEFGITRERNLLERWTETNAFTAIFRTHEGNQPEANAQFYDDAESLAHFARFAKVYAALMPYRSTLMAEAGSRGLPVVRHPLMEFPDDPYWYSMPDESLQFMLGSELMVAPVVEKNIEERTVYLPAGSWVHLWSGEVLGSEAEGTAVVQSAPVGLPPVYYRQGSTVGEALVTALSEANLL